MLRRHTKSLKIAITGICLLLADQASAITVTDVASGVTPAQMQTTLQGTGVTISNLTITTPAGCNSNLGVGLFTNGTSPVGPGPVLGEPTGVTLSSGAIAAANRLDSSNNVANVRNVLCAGAVSDADMVTLEPATVAGEYAAIEFDVVPQYTILAIPFQFGSDEFPEYVCSNFNDVVGIFVRGPGIAGPFSGGYQNYAKTAAGDLSSINWVNTGVVGQNGNIANCGSLANAAFYSDNSSGNATGGNATVATTNTNLEMDGFTNTLFQPITVVAGQTYHVKIAVADAGDLQWDSAAFIHPLFSTNTFSGFDYGDAPDSYGTLTTNGGPNHGIDSTIFMGAAVPDNEITGIPTVNADGDDLNNTDDEDGISGFPLLSTSATSYSVNVNVTNNSGNSARLVGWIDFNRNGIFESSEGTQTTVFNGTSGATVALNWPAISGQVAGITYARIRFSSDPGLSIFTTGSAMSDGEVEDYILTVGDPVFDTSSKTVIDVNGGAVDPGDVLQYTIAINETAGVNVQNVQLTDVVDANLGSINFTTLPAGATNNTVANNIDITGIAVPAGGTTTIVYEATIAGGTVPGTSIDNTATISHAASGVTFDAPAPTINVGSLPSSGIKQLYFDTVNATPNLTRVPPAGGTVTGNITGGATFTLNQGLVFQAPFSITNGNSINVQLRMRRRGGGGARTMQVQLFNGNTGALIGTNSTTWNANGWQTRPVPITIATDVNFSTNDFIQVVLTNTSANNRNIQLSSLQGGVRSEVQMQSNTVINVDSIGVFSAPFPATTQFSSYKPGSTVYIRATVSDPFGFADITGANLTITDPTPTVLPAVGMTSEASPTGAIRVYEYTYIIPPAPEGFWNLSVTATEGLETVPITHTAQSTMIVGTPNITISKNSVVVSDPVNATNPKAIPNAIVEYTIAVENSGFGYVDTNTFILTDPIDPSTAFYFGSPLNPAAFTDGATTSGLTFTFTSLASTTDDIDFSNDGGLSFITPSIDGNGFDTTVPPIDFIRINPKGEFNGSDGVNNPSMEIKFQVKVK